MSRDLRLLAGAAGLSALGDFLAFLPLVIHVQQRTGSAFAVAALFLALWGPVVVGAGVAGAIVDRFENRALLVGVSAAQAAIVAGIALSIDSLGVLIVLVALLGFCVAVVQPAEFALVPAAAGADVARANGRMEAARSLGFTFGPLAGGALGAAGLLSAALVIDAASFAIVAAVGLALRARRRPRRSSDTRVRARDGVRLLLGEPDLAITLGGAVAALALFTMSQTAEPFFVTGVLGAGSLGYGALITSWTLGMAAGAAGLAHRVPGTGPRGLRARRRRRAGHRDRRRRRRFDAGHRDDRVRRRRDRARGQERAAAHAHPRARARGAARPRLRRLQRRPQRRRARRADARRRPRRPRRRPHDDARRRHRARAASAPLALLLTAAVHTIPIERSGAHARVQG